MNRTLVAVAAAASVVTLASCSSTGDGAGQDAAMVQACKDRILAQLKSPSTAEFGPMPLESIAEVTRIGSADADEVTLTHTTRSWVDSQNGFGATLRSQFECKMLIREDGSAFASWQILDG